MKQFKKIFSLAVVATLVMATVTGCGTKSTGDDSTFVIGGLGPLTGDAASYGNSVKQGAKIAIDEINAAGGAQVGEKKVTLELNFQDDEAKEDKVVTAYNSLMDEGIDALLGTVTSGTGLAILDLTNEDGIFQITPSGSAQGLTKNSNTFRLCFTDPVQGETMADFVINELGKKKIAVIYNNSDEYSTGMTDAFEAKVKELGGEIVSSEAFAKGDVDFSAQLSSIKATDAEIIFVPTYYGEATFITQQASDLGMSLPFIGGDGWDGILEKITDATTIEGAIFLSPFFAADKNEKIVSFVEAYKKEYKETPDQFAADGYDTVYVMAAAMEKSGSTESADLIAAMTEIEVEGVTGPISFNADGEPNKSAKFIKVIDGAYTKLD